MSAGLFELRKDPVTGWWVAVVVDRAFDRGRFERTASPVAGHHCANCNEPPGEGIRLRTLKEFAFNLVGTEDEAHALDRGLGQMSFTKARASGSWRTVVAAPGEHRSLHGVEAATIVGLLAVAREQVALARAAGQTEYVQVVLNHGAEAGAMTNHLCFDLYDLPQLPHRVAEEVGGAARFLIKQGECPWCRLVRQETAHPERVVWQDAGSVAFAPYAARSPFEVWVVPRRHEADFGRAADVDLASTAEALREVLGLVATLGGPPYNLVLHTAPLRERVDETFHWHWEIHPRLRAIGGLELGTGLPVNPVSPEEAVEELRRGAKRSGPPPAPG